MQATIKNYAFQPNPIIIKPNMIITWTNDDQVPHTVTSDSGLFNSGVIKPGETYTHKFSKSGIFPYHCDIHPWMHGKVEVQGTQKGGVDFCEQFKSAGLECEPPEINALKTDIVIISVHLEHAIAFPSHKTITTIYEYPEIKKKVHKNLVIAQEWFGDIVMYLNLYSATKFVKLIEYVKKVQKYFDILKDHVNKTKNLGELITVCNGEIYGFQGVIGSLSKMIDKHVNELKY